MARIAMAALRALPCGLPGMNPGCNGLVDPGGGTVGVEFEVSCGSPSPWGSELPLSCTSRGAQVRIWPAIPLGSALQLAILRRNEPGVDPGAQEVDKEAEEPGMLIG
jgi:hypothetical protein